MRKGCKWNKLNAERTVIFNKVQKCLANKKRKTREQSQKKRVNTKHRLSSTKSRLLTEPYKIYENKRRKKRKKQLIFSPAKKKIEIS